MKAATAAAAAANEREARRARGLLIAGAAIGIALAASGALRPDPAHLPSDAVARVNHATIRLDEFERSIGLLAADKRNPLTDADRAHVLRRMIEEELLIQRGVAIGLVESDNTIRKSISAAMLQSIVAETASIQPSREELAAFYEESRGHFTTPGRLRVQRIFFRLASGDEPVERAVAALANGMAFDAVAREFGDAAILTVPDALLPPHKLREYLGPTPTRAAMQLARGEVSAPISTPTGVLILKLIDSEPAASPDFAAIEAQVEVEFRRRAGDQALREYLEWLWEEADIVLAEDAPR